MRSLLRRCSLAAAAVALLVLAGVGTRDVVSRIVFPDQPITFDLLGLLGKRLEAAYIPTVIKSVQRSTISIGAAATSNTATITSVSTANSVLYYLGNDYAAANTLASEYFCRLAFTNATTITANRNSQSGVSATVCSFEVIEYRPAVIKSNQTGTIALTGVASNTATVTSVNTAKSSLIFLGMTTNDGGGNGIFFQTKLVLTNATTITGTKGSATENTLNGYELIEFF